MSTFFSQLTYGRQSGRRIMPSWLRTMLNVIGSIASLALIAFWGYIYVTQSLYDAPNENLLAPEAFKISQYL